MSVTSGLTQSIVTVFLNTWWIFAPFILFPIFESTWIFWRQEQFKHDLQFVLLELRIPREIKKNPKAMEQVMMAIHALRNAPGDFKEKWIDGEVTRWYSLEMVSIGGEIHFYIRTYDKQKDLVEAAFFAYYPDIEIVEVEDYINLLPSTVGEMFKSGYDLWGTELLLNREEAYPIKSYTDFESMEEDKQYDPISVFLEVLGKVKREEIVGIQLVLSPAAPDWNHEFRGLIEELRSKKEGGGHGGAKKSAGLGMEFPHILPVFPVKGHGSEEKPENAFVRTLSRTPGETDVLKAIEENLSMPAFKTIIRFIYVSPKELYYDTFARRGIIGAFNQYGSLDLNSFKQNQAVSTRTRVWNWPHIFPAARNIRRKQRLLMSYRHREVPPETFMGRILLSKLLNWEHTEEFFMSVRSLATLFHPPTAIVLTAPHIKRMESRKTGPPAGLAIYGDEEEIDKFK